MRTPIADHAVADIATPADEAFVALSEEIKKRVALWALKRTWIGHGATCTSPACPVRIVGATAVVTVHAFPQPTNVTDANSLVTPTSP